METRQIKFKVWSENKMLKPTNLEWLKHGAKVPDDFNQNALWNLDAVFLQFTGLIDKNGKEIYEGDILLESYKIKHKENGKELLNENTYSVVWGHQEGDCESSYYHGWRTSNGNSLVDGKDITYGNQYWELLEMKYEIIGNIYENPELLK